MKVFLFPLINVTLFPKTTKPLNVFEKKYLDMVKISVEEKTSIAIGYVEDAQVSIDIHPGEIPQFVRAVAGFGTPQLIEERANGTQLIFLHGLGKVKLGAVTRVDRGFIECDAEVIAEDTELKPESLKKLEHLTKILLRWITIHIPDPLQREIFLRNVTSPEEVVGAFSAYLIRDYDLQQIVLEFNHLDEKINYLHRLAESSETTSV